MPRPTVAPLVLCAVLAVALAQPAAADEGALQAREASFNDPSHQEGRLAMAFAFDAATLEEGAGPTGSVPRLEATAASLEAVTYRTSYVGADAGRKEETAEPA